METNALIALFKKVQSLDILPVFFPNVAKDTDGETEPQDNHARVQVINTAPETLGISDGKSHYIWILQIDVYTRSNTGIINAMNYAQSYKDNIPFGSLITESNVTLKTLTAGEIIPPIMTDGWVVIPVQFRASLIK